MFEQPGACAPPSTPPPTAVSDRVVGPPVRVDTLAVWTAEPGSMSDDELSQTTIELERLVAWAGARQARMVAERARRHYAQLAGLTGLDARSDFLPDEIGVELAISRMGAHGRIATAMTLAERLSTTISTWEHGDLDAGKAQIIAENADRLAHLPDLVPAFESKVLPRAAGQTHGQLRQACNRAIHRLDPDLDGRRHRRAYADRRVVLTPAEDGMAKLWALLPAPAARALYDRLTAIAGRADPTPATGTDPTSTDPTVPGPAAGSTDPAGAAAGSTDPAGPDTAGPAAGGGTGPTRGGEGADGAGDSGSGTAPPAAASLDARRADALADLGMGACTCQGAECTAGNVDIQLHVIVQAGTLLGLDDQPAYLAGHGLIPATMARKLSIDATWRRILTDPATGAATDVSRSYRPPPAMAALVRARDRECRFPGCRRAAHQCDIDHHQPHAAGGATTPPNLITYCRHHHLLKHRAPGWTVDLDTGEIVVTTPHGTTRTTRPHDHRPDPPPTSAPPNPDPGDPPR